jgi:hypothetical protein
MRDYLNAILQFVSAESLTDEEFEAITLESTVDQVAVYNVLLGVLEAREVVSAMTTRLQNYFLAKGVAVSEPSSPASNIFVGSCIE